MDGWPSYLHCSKKVWYMTVPSWAPHIYKWYPTQLKRLGCVLSCLCDWCRLKTMCGPLEYAQPPHFYLPDMRVWVCEMSKCVALKAERGGHCPTWHSRPVCYPESWSGRRWLLLNIKEWQRKELGLSQNEWVTVKSAIDIVKCMK